MDAGCVLGDLYKVVNGAREVVDGSGNMFFDRCPYRMRMRIMQSYARVMFRDNALQAEQSRAGMIDSRRGVGDCAAHCRFQIELCMLCAQTRVPCEQFTRFTSICTTIYDSWISGKHASWREG